MSVSDPISDLLTRIRNALKAQHKYLEVRWSKMKQSIVEILVQEGLVESYIVQRDGAKAVIRVVLKYGPKRQGVIQGLKRVSTPGCRKYVQCTEIPRFYGNFGVSILSTSKGVMSGKNAKKNQIGGELLCLVW